MRITIGTKLNAGFMLVLLLLVALTYYSVSISQKSLKESVGNSSMFLAEEILNRIEQNIYLKIEELQKYSKVCLLQKTILASNREFEKLDSTEEYINRKDREWISASRDEITPFMKILIKNELSDELREEFIQFYKKKYGYDVFEVVSVTNRYGVNVAQTGKTSDYRQGAEEWWQVSRGRGFYVGDVEYGEIIETHGITIGVSIDDKEGNFIGVMRGKVGAKEIIREAEISTKKHETTAIKLITKNGKLIYETRAFKFLEDVSEKEFFKKIKAGSGFFISKEGGREKLFSYVHSKGYKSFEGHEWIFVVGHDIEEVLRPAFVLRNNMMGASLILITMTIIIAFLMSRSITKPIAKLSNGAEIVGKGNLEHRVELKTKDEIGELAVTFNRMIEKRQVAEEALRESEERFRFAFENANDGVCLVDTDGNLVRVNNRMRDIFGYSKKELESMTVNDIAHPEDRDISPKFIEKSMSGEVESTVFEKRYIHKQGHMIWGQVSSSIVKDAIGDPLCFISHVQDITQRRQTEEALRKSEANLRSLAVRLTEVEEAHRKILATELHDRVGQNLSALNINLNIIKNRLSREPAEKIEHRLSGAMDIVEETTERIRDVMADLRPEVLEDYGLIAALRWHGERFMKQTGIETVIQGEELKHRLPLPTETALFRIAQEAMTNVSKHARAACVTVSFDEEDEGSRLTVSDDGVGFDPKVSDRSGQEHRWGLIIMRERAQSIGVQLRIESEPGKGSTVIAEVRQQNEEIL